MPEDRPSDPCGPASMQQRVVSPQTQFGGSRNTTQSYRAAIRYWIAWFQARYHAPMTLPVPEAAVLQFIADHAERLDENGEAVIELPRALDAALVLCGFRAHAGRMAISTLAHRLSVLSALHRSRGLPSPCHSPSVRELMSRARRGYANRGLRPKEMAPLARDPLERVLATCDTSLRGLRDRALLLFAWSSGGRRRSEVAGAKMESLSRIQEGYLYDLRESRAERAANDRPGMRKPIVGPAADALAAWLVASGITSGAIFRRVYRGGRLGKELHAAAVRDIVKARCRLAGLDGEFSAHSLRSGFITEASSQGASLGEIMAMTGHASVATVMRYQRRGFTVTSTAAHLIELPVKDP